MPKDFTVILNEALKLPTEARAALAGTLFESLEESFDPDAELAWEKEITRRLKDIDENRIQPIPWTEARTKITGR